MQLTNADNVGHGENEEPEGAEEDCLWSRLHRNLRAEVRDSVHASTSLICKHAHLEYKALAFRSLQPQSFRELDDLKIP